MTRIKQIRSVIILDFLSLCISQLFMRLNEPLLHAWVSDKSLYAGSDGIRHKTHHNRSWDQIELCVCVCETVICWHRFPDALPRFTGTESRRQTWALPRTTVSSLRRLSDSFAGSMRGVAADQIHHKKKITLSSFFFAFWLGSFV